MSGLAEEYLDESNSKFWLKRIGMMLVLLAVGVGGWLLFSSLVSSKVSMKKPMTTVKLLPDTPPPPPPPPKEQPKEQPKEMKVEPPKQQEVPPAPPSEMLKMEGAAGDGPSPFAAGTVNNEYKGGDVGTKIGGKKGMAAYAWYTSQIKARIEDALAAEKDLSTAQYRLVVHLWLSKDGRIERTEMQESSGNPKTDELIKKALADIAAIAEVPPEDMPQPVKLRITSKKSG
jgi:outer membrane biosynthesis protein TonB